MQLQNSNRTSNRSTKALKSDLEAPQLCPPKSMNPQHALRRWVGRTTRRLSIHKKISLGYAIALGIAVLGTTTGFVVGDYYQRQAKVLEEHAQEKIRLLHRLQAGILQARTHQQQLIPLLQQPELLQEEHFHFQRHIAYIEQLISETRNFIHHLEFVHVGRLSSSTQQIQALLQTYGGVPTEYSWRLSALLDATNPVAPQQENIDVLQVRLLRFTNGSVALKLDGFSDDLTEVIETAYQEDAKAQAELARAENIRVQIIVASIVLSIAIAALLAAYTSRAIARPIQTVTDVAQRATKESNFDLQAAVTTEDEVGVLTASLNQLIQRVRDLLEEQKAEASQQLIQSEKMSSLGRMVAGVAHEINNPINFICGNLNHANEYVEDLLTLLQTYKAETANPTRRIKDQEEKIDLEFLQEDLPKIFKSMKVGTDRVQQIILSLKNFSRLDEAAFHSVDLHACIDSALLILNNRLKKGITVVRNYDTIPLIDGYTGALYQVFMNLLSNAVEALEEGSTSRQIVITTERLNHQQVMIQIADNGPGISLENQAKIFDTFFTTKPRGIGTGLGLSISHQIVVEKHQGSLTCASRLGEGTEFTIILPIKNPDNKEAITKFPSLSEVE